MEAARRWAALLLGVGAALAATVGSPSPCAATAGLAASPAPSRPAVSSPRQPTLHAPSPWRHRAARRGWAPGRRLATGPWFGGVAPAAPPAAGPAVVLHTPGDAASSGRRRLIHADGVDEGFLLGLPTSGGPITYLPPRPEREAVDPASATLAALAGLLAATGGGALLLALRLERPAARRAAVSVALAPAARRRRHRERRSARLSRETFDRLPPLLQLALLDRSHGSPPEVADAAPR